MPSSKGRSKGPVGGPSPTRSVTLERELIVLTEPGAGVVAAADGALTLAAESLGTLASALGGAGAKLAPLFPGGPDAAMADAPFGAPSEMMPVDDDVPALGGFFRATVPDKDMESLRDELVALPQVAGAYIKEPAEPASDVIDLEESINEMLPAGGGGAAAATPDFTPRQEYLNTAPGGIDARYAWSLAGGRGHGIKIIDCEWGWRFTHEDLGQRQIGVIGGTSTTSRGFENHGTAVIGVIGGDRNNFGVTGICPDAVTGASSFVGQSSSTAIVTAANQLSAGDLMILEIHRPGPNATGQGQFGFIAIEWWPDDYAAIRYAQNKGILVCEAAGNGFQNLDDPAYNTPLAGFPQTWRNPFDPANPTSGAIVIGAGAPPPGTHGSDHGPDRSRLGFSNYGRRVDAQGWGREVTTTGYGDLSGDSDANNNLAARNRWYTDQFSGTSSASPVVTGALACAQGVLKAQGSSLLTPASARSLLRSTGSPQQDAPGRPATQRIGNRPDLKELIPKVAKVWHHHKTIQTTYAVSTTMAVWIRVSDIGWRRIHPDSPDGVNNILTMAIAAQANGRTVHVYADGAYVYRMYVL